jgi:signal transduction histidine kinase
MRLISQPGAVDPLPAPNPLAVLAATEDADLNEIVSILQSVCQSAYAGISIPRGDSCELVIAVGVEPFQTQPGEAFCLYLMDCHYIFEIDDASLDERFHQSAHVTGEALQVRSFASAPIYDSGDEMVGRLCVFDPDARKLDEGQLRALGTLARNVSRIVALHQQRQDQSLEQSAALPVSEEVLSVAAQISHDMRLPIAALSLTLGMLEEVVTEEDRQGERRLVLAAQRSAKRLNTMVEGILEMHQVKANLSLGSVDLQRLARDAIAELGPILHKSGASLKVSELPTVRGDERLIFRVFLNLINNAVKFARPGIPPQIRMDSRRRDAAWEVSVTDNGLGVPSSKQKLVFETFARLHPNKPGNGIGLPTVAQIVAAHGGEVGIRDTSSGQGAEFWFTLPDQ